MPTLSEWSNQLRRRAASGNTQYPLYTGGTVYLPTLRPHAAGNYAVQRTARELLVDALLRWRDTPWGRCMLLPVHDEIIAMVPEDQGDAATAAWVNCMQTEFRGVPIVAEADPPASAGLTLPEPGPETSPSPGYTAPLGRSPGHRRGLGRGSSPMDIDDDAHTIGRCVRHIRYARGESLRVVAELAGISRTCWYQ